jgi:hypothetical protein
VSLAQSSTPHHAFNRAAWSKHTTGANVAEKPLVHPAIDVIDHSVPLPLNQPWTSIPKYEIKQSAPLSGVPDS